MFIQEDYFKNIFNTVREAILILDENMRVLSANRSFFTTFKVDAANTIGSLLYDLGNGHGTSRIFACCSRIFFRRTTPLMTTKLNIILRVSDRKPCS